MKKNLILVLSLSLTFSLVGCSSDKSENKSIQTVNENQTVEDSSKNSNNLAEAATKENNVDEKQEKDSKNESSKQSNKTSSNEQASKDKDKNNVSEKTTKVNSKVKLYEGTYFDNRRFGENTLNNYCELVISNITNTSFDFTVYEVNVSDNQKENKKIIFLKNTAVFTGDGTKAAFYGKDYTLNFTFPNNHNAYPVVTDIEIAGFEPLKGKTYVNNGIPGHEFG